MRVDPPLGVAAGAPGRMSGTRKVPKDSPAQDAPAARLSPETLRAVAGLIVGAVVGVATLVALAFWGEALFVGILVIFIFATYGLGRWGRGPSVPFILGMVLAFILTIFVI